MVVFACSQRDWHLRIRLCHALGVPGTASIQLPPSHFCCRIILCVYLTSNWSESCIECPGLTPWECTISPRKMNTPLSMGWSFNNWSTISQNLSLFSRSRLAKSLAISWSCIVFLNLLQGLCRGLYFEFSLALTWPSSDSSLGYKGHLKYTHFFTLDSKHVLQINV